MKVIPIFDEVVAKQIFENLKFIIGIAEDKGIIVIRNKLTQKAIYVDLTKELWPN